MSASPVTHLELINPLKWRIVTQANDRYTFRSYGTWKITIVVRVLSLEKQRIGKKKL